MFASRARENEGRIVRSGSFSPARAGNGTFKSHFYSLRSLQDVQQTPTRRLLSRNVLGK
jgi:hypothetical protein